MNVSFVIPSWNYAEYIGKAIHSIMDGNLEDGDEIVICDDHSDDDSVKVIANLPPEWPIYLVQHDRRKGEGATYNTAIRNATHPLLFSLDADNLLIPDSVPELKRFLLERGADVAAFKGMYYFGSLPKMVCWPMDTWTLDHHLSGASLPAASGNYLFTREIWERVGGYPEDTWLGSWGFDFRMAAARAKMMVMPSLYYYHRRGHYSAYIRGMNQESVSHAAYRAIEPYLHLLDKQDVEYIRGAGRDIWYDKLKERPLRRRDETVCVASGG